MQALLNACARLGFDHCGTGTGGEKRSGGLNANGMPRNLLTVTVEEGRFVTVPITVPESMVAVGSGGGLKGT